MDDLCSFLDAASKKIVVRVSDYFSNTDKFIKSVDRLTKPVGPQDEKKRLRSKKHITTLTRAEKPDRHKKTKGKT